MIREASAYAVSETNRGAQMTIRDYIPVVAMIMPTILLFLAAVATLVGIVMPFVTG